MVKRLAIILSLVLIAAYLIWRSFRPMNVFIIEDKIAWPIDTSKAPALFGKLNAKTCGNCHKKFYQEWKTTIHSKAWTDPYFKADMKFDGNQFVCRLCHTPLDQQLPSKVLGYRDKNKWDPILTPNPNFNPKLQHEGVTCAVCHLRNGKILGVLGNTNAPHPVKIIDSPNQICVRCHVSKNEKFGVFSKLPICGTVAEITKSKKTKIGESIFLNVKSLGCVNCHMPLEKRPLVEGGPIRNARRHLWRGGHDPNMVKKAITVTFNQTEKTNKNYTFKLSIVNSGAAHYVPTGTPDRHFTIKLLAYGKFGKVIKQKLEIIKRNFIWRPFIFELSDTRLRPGLPRNYIFQVSVDEKPAKVEVIIRYHLLDEKRRRRINYKNVDPISYEVFRKEIKLLN